ncbi:MAG: hypothetical protein KGQ70_04935, partial [Alphaproteobacteria bacterium]|nr:hypothetical protein [Alphaproteobacteria bacterium]
FKAESFPLYTLLLENKEAGVDAAIRAFELAQKGGDAEKYNFALGLQTVAYEIYAPGQTAEINRETLKACLAVFEEQAERHAPSALMAAYNRLCGFGCEIDKAAARKWLDKAEALGGKSEIIDAMRVQAAEPPKKKGLLGKFKPKF